MTKNNNVNLFVEQFIENDVAVKAHLYKYIWVSGSNTQVRPITIWTPDKRIEIQWEVSDLRTARGFIKRMKSHTEFVTDAVFTHSDGSCPATVTVYYK